MQVAVQYIELDSQMLMGSQQVSEGKSWLGSNLSLNQRMLSLSSAATYYWEGSSTSIAEIQEKIQSGTDFADLAKQYSDDLLLPTMAVIWALPLVKCSPKPLRLP